MRKSEEKALRAQMRQLQEAFRLGHWDISLVFDETLEDEYGNCAVTVPYRQATIRLNPAAVDESSSLLDTLYHEMAHVLLYECMELIPESYRNKRWLSDYIEYHADRIGRLVQHLNGDTP